MTTRAYRTQARTTARTVTLACPVCLDGDVDVAVVVEPLGYGPSPESAYAENCQAIECSDGCHLSVAQITDLCERAEERALEDYRA